MNCYLRRVLIPGIVLAGLLGAPALLSSASADPLPPGCVQVASTVTCTVGIAMDFVVPSGVSSVHVRAVGGRGGNTSYTGGAGAVVEADLPVTPGSTLFATVGTSGTPGTAGGFGGFYDGGNGGSGGSGYGAGGGGGGTSEIRTVLGDVSSRVLVAAGGGGAGAGGAGIGTSYPHGGAAGNTGGGDGGAPGTAVASGLGGGNGNMGVLNVGGAGGPGVTTVLQFGGGGGGGGGLFGGGGGGGGGINWYGGGGGGGSSLVPAGGTSTLATAAETPVIVISYQTIPLPTITITSGPPPAGVVGQPYSYQYTASGDTGITYAVTAGALPAGLTLTSAGLVSGTPTTAGTSNFTVKATGQSGGAASRSDALTVNAVPLPTITINSGPPPAGTVGQPYSYQYTASGDTGITFALSAGALPAGLTLTSAGLVSGTPTAAGTYDFTVKATGQSGATASRPDSVTVTATAPAATVSPTSVAFASTTVGRASGRRTVTVSNTGTAPLAVTSALIEGTHAGDFKKVTDACTGQTVAVSGSCKVELTFTPAAKGLRTATLAFATNASGSPHAVALSGTGVLRADLAVAARATPSPVRSGSTVTYTITVTNHGPHAASQVRLNDVLPRGVEFKSVTKPSGWSCTVPPVGSTGTLSCTRSTLASGSTTKFTIAAKVVVNGPTTITNTATVSSSTSDPNAANNSAGVDTTVPRTTTAAS